MRGILFSLIIMPLAGCLTSSPPVVAYWPLTYIGDSVSVKKSSDMMSIESAPASKPTYKFGAVRLSQVVVRPPFDTDRISVLRVDGSMAFDDLNRFACAPSLLVKSAAMDALIASKKFPSVVWTSSSAGADCGIEIEIRKIALDCRISGKREALMSIAISLVDKHRGILSMSTAEATADASSGNYADAFSSAFSKAITSALREL